MQSSKFSTDSLEQTLAKGPTPMEEEARRFAGMSEAEREEEFKKLKQDAKDNPSARAWFQSLARHLSAFYDIEIDIEKL